MHDHTDIVVLTIFTDVKLVSVYTVYNMVMHSLKKIQSIFTTGTEPIFGSMWAKGELDKIEKNLSVFELLVNAFNAVAFGTAIVVILPFVSLYIPKNVTDVNYILPLYSVIISLAFATQGMRVPYLALVQGIGHYKQTRNAAILEAVINIVISVILVNIIGVVGVAVGTLVANVYRSIVYAIYIEKKVLHRGMHVFFLKFFWTMVCMAIIIIPGRMLEQNIMIDSWMKWILVSACVGIYSSIIVLSAAFICYRKDTKYAFQVVKAMIYKKRK